MNNAQNVKNTTASQATVQENSDQELLQSLRVLRSKEMSVLASFLESLLAVEEQDLHLQEGYSSLFNFLVRRFHYSEGAAARRVAGVRVLKMWSGLLPMIREGEVHLSAIHLLFKHLNPGNVESVIRAWAGKSKREVEAYVAATFGVRQKVRRKTTLRFVARATTTTPASYGSSSGDNATSENRMNGTTRDDGSNCENRMSEAPHRGGSSCEKKANGTVREDGSMFYSENKANELSLKDIQSSGLHGSSVAVGQKSEKFEPASIQPTSSDDRPQAHATAADQQPELLIKIGLTMSEQAFKNIERLQELLGCHDIGEALEKAVAFYLAKKDLLATSPAKAAARSKAKSDLVKQPETKSSTEESLESSSLPPQSVNTTESKARPYIAKAVRRTVYTRDQGQCSFVSESGERCGSRHHLEFDHQVPWAQGGKDTVENLVLMCKMHNLYRAREVFGSNFIEAKIRAAAQ